MIDPPDSEKEIRKIMRAGVLKLVRGDRNYRVITLRANS